MCVRTFIVKLNNVSLCLATTRTSITEPVWITFLDCVGVRQTFAKQFWFDLVGLHCLCGSSVRILSAFSELRLHAIKRLIILLYNLLQITNLQGEIPSLLLPVFLCLLQSGHTGGAVRSHAMQSHPKQFSHAAAFSPEQIRLCRCWDYWMFWLW